jgi:hypothetical protein
MSIILSLMWTNMSIILSVMWTHMSMILSRMWTYMSNILSRMWTHMSITLSSNRNVDFTVSRLLYSIILMCVHIRHSIILMGIHIRDMIRLEIELNFTCHSIVCKPSSHICFLVQSLLFCVVFCKNVSLFLWSLYCLSFFEFRLLIILLASSNFSLCYTTKLHWLKSNWRSDEGLWLHRHLSL